MTGILSCDPLGRGLRPEKVRHPVLGGVQRRARHVTRAADLRECLVPVLPHGTGFLPCRTKRLRGHGTIDGGAALRARYRRKNAGRRR